MKVTYYNSTDTCDRIKDDRKKCGRGFDGKAYKEKDAKGNWTKNWICSQCYYILKTYGTTDKYSIIKDGRGKIILKYNVGDICPRCREDDGIVEYGATEKNRLRPGNATQEKDKDGNGTGRTVCIRHWKKDYDRYDLNSDNNIRKSLANCRTDNQNPNHSSTKGDNSQRLACKLYGYEDLNEKNDNYNVPIDCLDPKTGLLYQVRGKAYDPVNRCYMFGYLEREWYKDYEDMICFCKSENEKRIEEIYRFSSSVIKGRVSIKIVKYRVSGIGILYENGWYEKYRVIDEDELKRANDIWKEIVAQNITKRG